MKKRSPLEFEPPTTTSNGRSKDRGHVCPLCHRGLLVCPPRYAIYHRVRDAKDMSRRRQRVSLCPAHARSPTPRLPPPTRHGHEQRPRTSLWTPSRYTTMRLPPFQPWTRRAAVGPSASSRFASGPDAQDRRIARAASFRRVAMPAPRAPQSLFFFSPLFALPPTTTAPASALSLSARCLRGPFPRPLSLSLPLALHGFYMVL